MLQLKYSISQRTPTFASVYTFEAHILHGDGGKTPWLGPGVKMHAQTSIRETATDGHLQAKDFTHVVFGPYSPLWVPYVKLSDCISQRDIHLLCTLEILLEDYLLDNTLTREQYRRVIQRTFTPEELARLTYLDQYLDIPTVACLTMDIPSLHRMLRMYFEIQVQTGRSVHPPVPCANVLNDLLDHAIVDRALIIKHTRHQYAVSNYLRRRTGQSESLIVHMILVRKKYSSRDIFQRWVLNCIESNNVELFRWIAAIQLVDSEGCPLPNRYEFALCFDGFVKAVRCHRLHWLQFMFELNQDAMRNGCESRTISSTMCYLFKTAVLNNYIEGAQWICRLQHNVIESLPRYLEYANEDPCVMHHNTFEYIRSLANWEPYPDLMSIAICAARMRDFDTIVQLNSKSAATNANVTAHTIQACNWSMLRWLTNQGVTYTTWHLECAIMTGNVKTVRFVLGKVTLDDYTISRLSEALVLNLRVLQWLDKIIPLDYNKITMIAFKKNNIKTIEWLLKRKFNWGRWVKECNISMVQFMKIIRQLDLKRSRQLKILIRTAVELLRDDFWRDKKAITELKHLDSRYFGQLVESLEDLVKWFHGRFMPRVTE